MASPAPSPVPSSSANTIPIPGKSILKRPPPTQSSFFSRIKGFLPTQAAPSSSESKPLKRAHFILPQIAVVYPISSINPPSTPSLKEEKKAIEDREAERRKRVVRGNSISSTPNETEEWWNLDKVESFYRECCASREEQSDPAITAAFKRASGTNPRSVDLSGAQITVTSAAILSDVFTIEWGLRKLVFRECDLDELMLKPMLHALLIPGTLSFLSVASNRRLKAPAYRIIGAYVSKAKTLQFLDLSQNPLDKKSIEYVVAALTTPPESGLISLRLDDCSLRPSALEALSRSVRTSSLRNISLRHNKISPTGAVALALMIRDYPDVVPAASTASSPSGTPLSPTSSLNSFMSTPPSTPTASSPSSSILSLPPPPRTGPLPPPPRHPGSTPQTTYTPYIPRSRRGLPISASPNPLSPTGQQIPIITSSAQGGITTRHPVAQAGQDSHTQPRHVQGPSAALLDKVRALDALPRLGALRTLDLKGNDLRGGITYVAQVLKRNRTLKVLNLSENKLDVQALVSIAEALKYNSCLETLDISKNPCSGPELDGIQSLRTAFTLNTALKRLFLSSTQMTSAGAIALAEFLPESTSLLHLDLTINNLDIAGVMALSSGLKANHTMRCLDLNIPPGDDEFARMCRDILNSCVRNTEEAEKISRGPEHSGGGGSGRGLGKGVWGMIEESELAKTIRKGEGKTAKGDISTRVRMSISELEHLLSPSTTPTFSASPLSTPTIQQPSNETIIKNAKENVEELTKFIQTDASLERMEELLGFCDELNGLLVKLSSTRPKLHLQGLGLDLSGVPRFDINGNYGFANGNGALHSESPDQDDDTEEPSPTTPKVDKGKGRAEPEPEQHEPVLSPSPRNFLVGESEDEDEDGHRFLEIEENGGVASPTDRSRSWVEEEGEVFRKGNVLLGPNEMEGEYAGEDLRKELLEAMVERPPPRPLVDEFGVELNPPSEDSRASSPVSASPQEPTKPPPRPYISRTRSSEASPVTPTQASPLQSPRSVAMSPTLPMSPAIAGRPYQARDRSSSSSIHSTESQ